MKGFADLQKLPENERIKYIAKYIEEHPQEIVGVAIESISKNKIKRYIGKVMLKAPNALVHEKVSMNGLTVIKFKHKDCK